MNKVGGARIMKVKSTRFGEIEVSEQAILQFPHGIPGFIDEKVFAFLPYDVDSPFAFLQSVNEPDLTFMIMEPFSFFPDYDFELDNSIVKALGFSDKNPPQIFNIIRMTEKLEEMTANLLAPIIVNWQNRKAMQYVLDKTSYNVRHRVFPDGLPQQADKGGQ
ncbi:MAG: fliW [Pelosinus sp.]|jgi:flagellar assembly factor FliW|nr:fliW [Pelosinus sp.]